MYIFSAYPPKRWGGLCAADHVAVTRVVQAPRESVEVPAVVALPAFDVGRDVHSLSRFEWRALHDHRFCSVVSDRFNHA